MEARGVLKDVVVQHLMRDEERLQAAMVSMQQAHEPTLEGGQELTTADERTMECPDCMSVGTFSVQPHEVVISVGNDAVIATVNAAVCGVCGYETVDGMNATKLDDVRARMERGDMSGMEPVGTTYRVNA
jgi:hypothetical protein